MCFYKLSVAPQLGQGAEKFLDEISFKTRNFLILILKNLYYPSKFHTPQFIILFTLSRYHYKKYIENYN